MTSTCVKMINFLCEDGAEGSFSNPVKFKGQDFKKLKESLLGQRKTFQDETFPANLDSLGELEGFTAKDLKEVEWLRPTELHPDASFIVDGASRFDFMQGHVGNCWFLSALGALTLRKPLMVQVLPRDQSIKDHDYAGIFHFRFWRFGRWLDVVIDDLLPTKDKLPLSVSSVSGKEFWAPLLEKAYAKICGSYGDMIAGNPSEALKDFSGAVHMTYMLTGSQSDLWDTMSRAVHSKTMMGCSTFCGNKGEKVCDRFGLVPGHAFGMTGVRQVESNGEMVSLVRIWNPWGSTEWDGDWGDKSALWQTVSSSVRMQCLNDCDDGEFWMKLEDFCDYFEMIDICCDSPNFVDGDAACQWNCSLKEGRWEAGKNAGGCQWETEQFWTNPQYRLTVKPMEGDKAGNNNVLLSLLQKPDEEYRTKVKYHNIGFMIFKVPSQAPKGRLPLSLFQDQEPLKMSLFIDERELIEVYSFEPGEYLIIPCTFEPDKTSTFIITIYTKAEALME